jgi:hypothetical protein
MKKMHRASKGMNMPNSPKHGPSAAGPKDTSGGVSLQKGYNVVKENGMSPRAVAQNK